MLGEVAASELKRFGLEGTAAAAELRLDAIEFAVDRPRRLVPQSDYPAVDRDLNLVVDRVVPWGDLERAIRAADTHDRAIESIRLVQVWEDAERLGPGKKSMVVGLRLRSASGTISSDESRRIVEGIVATCGRECAAVLRG